LGVTSPTGELLPDDYLKDLKLKECSKFDVVLGLIRNLVAGQVPHLAETPDIPLTMSEVTVVSKAIHAFRPELRASKPKFLSQVRAGKSKI
jgi:hypothetical protein